MNWVSKTLSIFATLVLGLSAVAATVDDNGVFDIDWTIANTLSRGERPDLFVEGQNIRLVSLAIESLLRMHIEGFKVSFFSGGVATRNAKIIQLIYDRMRKKAMSLGLVMILVPDKILSAEDMEEAEGTTEKTRFRLRYDKNLLMTKTGEPRFPEDHVLAFDDVMEFAVKGQERLFINAGPTYDNFDSYREVVVDGRNIKPEYVPSNARFWRLDQYRMVWGTQLMIEAKRAAAKSGKPLWQERARIETTTSRDTLLLRGLHEIKLMERKLCESGLSQFL